MADVKTYPTCWQQWIGQLAIKCETENCGPQVVFVTHFSPHMGSLIGKTLNSGVMMSAKPRQLVSYTPRLFECLQRLYVRRTAIKTLSKATAKLRKRARKHG